MAYYAIVDCAADDGLYAALSHETKSQSLLDGKISPDLIDATPHIVEVAEGSALLVRIWAGQQPLGILCQSAQSLSKVRRQLRHNLQVMLPDGQMAMFRFYDPRVFPSYIENAPGEGLLPWFGAIVDWFVPVEAGVLQYQAVDGQLVRRLLAR